MIYPAGDAEPVHDDVQGCGLLEAGEQGGAVQAPTPHFVALARAQQAAVNNTPTWQVGYGAAWADILLTSHRD